MEIDREIIEKVIRQILAEEKGESTIMQFSPLNEKIDESNRLNTGNPSHRVYTKDLLNTAQHKNSMGFGVMEMEKTTFDWTLNYEEIDVILEGELSIIMNGQPKCAKKGEALFIPKGSSIQFSTPTYAKFLYITYPADWENQ